MANDMDMWNDIGRLERTGQKKVANTMMKVYTAWFMEGDEKKTKKAVADAWIKHKKFYFDFSNYGIPEPSIKEFERYAGKESKKLRKVV